MRQFARTKGEDWQNAANDRDKWSEWEEEFVAVAERVREEESWDQYDEVFDNLPVARPVVHA